MRHRAGAEPEAEDDREVEAEGDGLGSVAGASVAGASVAGASVAGASVAGASVAGASVGGVRSARVRIGVGAGVVILIVALVGAVLANAFAQQGSGREVSREPSSASASGTGTASGAPAAGISPTAAGGKPVLVHVLGAVNRPGLVSLSTGARVVDAVAAAGGLTGDAEVSGINLARALADGEQLVVPRVGEVVVPPAGAASGADPPGASGASGALVNLNTASQAELETLPRIGPALAGRILDYRTANGPFAAVTDLMKVTGIGQKLFDGFKDRITV